MTVTVEIPLEMQPLIAAAWRTGALPMNRSWCPTSSALPCRSWKTANSCGGMSRCPWLWPTGANCAKRTSLRYAGNSAMNTTNPAGASDGTRLLDGEGGRERA